MTDELDLHEFETKKSRDCLVPTLTLDKEQRAKLTAALERKTISTYAIKKVLDGWGQPLAQATIQKHRDNNCTCYRVR